jgi:hypothetical protein
MFWFVGESCPEGGRGCGEKIARIVVALRQRVGLKSVEGERYERIEALLVADQDAESFDVQAADGHSPQAMHGGYESGGVGRRVAPGAAVDLLERLAPHGMAVHLGFIFEARSVAERRFSIDEETHLVRSFADESF